MLLKNFISFIFVFLLLANWAAFAQSTSIYNNPIDDKNYVADWHTYKPQGSNESSLQNELTHIKPLSVRLMNTQSEFESQMTVPTLSEFIKAVGRSVDVASAGALAGNQLMIQITIYSDKDPSYEMARKGDFSEKQLTLIYEAIGKTLSPGPRTRNKPFTFQVSYEILKS